MSGEYKATWTCGCAIHVAQWTAKRQVVSQKSCPLHLAAAEMLAALKVIESCLAPEDHDTAAIAVRSAIAKAEGK